MKNRRDLMDCWYCGSELIWNCDYDFADYAITDREGIVTVLTCSNSNCGACFEGYLSYDKEEEDLGEA